MRIAALFSAALVLVVTPGAAGADCLGPPRAVRIDFQNPACGTRCGVVYWVAASSDGEFPPIDTENLYFTSRSTSERIKARARILTPDVDGLRAVHAVPTSDLTPGESYDVGSNAVLVRDDASALSVGVTGLTARESAPDYEPPLPCHDVFPRPPQPTLHRPTRQHLEATIDSVVQGEEARFFDVWVLPGGSPVPTVTTDPFDMPDPAPLAEMVNVVTTRGLPPLPVTPGMELVVMVREVTLNGETSAIVTSNPVRMAAPENTTSCAHAPIPPMAAVPLMLLLRRRRQH